MDLSSRALFCASPVPKALSSRRSATNARHLAGLFSRCPCPARARSCSAGPNCRPPRTRWALELFYRRSQRPSRHVRLGGHRRRTRAFRARRLDRFLNGDSPCRTCMARPPATHRRRWAPRRRSPIKSQRGGTPTFRLPHPLRHGSWPRRPTSCGSDQGLSSKSFAPSRSTRTPVGLVFRFHPITSESSVAEIHSPSQPVA